MRGGGGGGGGGILRVLTFLFSFFYISFIKNVNYATQQSNKNSFSTDLSILMLWWCISCEEGKHKAATSPTPSLPLPPLYWIQAGEHGNQVPHNLTLNNWVIFLEMQFCLLILSSRSAIFLCKTGPIQWIFCQHGGYWCSGAKVPGHQYLQC